VESTGEASAFFYAPARKTGLTINLRKGIVVQVIYPFSSNQEQKASIWSIVFFVAPWFFLIVFWPLRAILWV